jgi:ABC-2 type transport system ATP-binding protein
VIIEVEHLAKTFVRRTKAGRLRRERTEVPAVVDVSMTIERGELVGYLGPNGAGKSTTIKMMSGILAPSSGRVLVDGLVPMDDRKQLARRIGVVFGQRSNLWWDLPLTDSFDLLRHLYRVDAARASANRDWLTELFDLGELLPVPVRQLSLGQRMRGELVAALLHDPPVVFLDEPTIGLDVVSKHAVREALSTLQRERGTTILLTTHDLGDVERLCRRVIIIDHGRAIYDGSLEELVRRHQPERTLVVDLDVAVPPLDVDGLRAVRTDGPRQWLSFDPATMTAAEAIARVSAVAPVRDLTIEEPEVEEIIRRIYSGDGVGPDGVGPDGVGPYGGSTVS